MTRNKSATCGLRTRSVKRTTELTGENKKLREEQEDVGIVHTYWKVLFRGTNMRSKKLSGRMYTL